MILLIFLLLLFAGSAEAATRYVDTGCSNGITTYVPGTRACTGGSATSYNTVANGVAATFANDTLLLRAGNYNEIIDYRHQTANAGSAGNPVTIAAYPGNCFTPGVVGPGGPCETVTMSGASPWGDAVILPRPYWTIDGIHIDATGSIYGVNASTNGIFKNMDIYNSAVALKRDGMGFMIQPTNNNNQIINTKVHDLSLAVSPADAGLGSHGIYLQADGNTVEYSEFYNIGQYGIQLYPAGSNNIIRYSTFHDTQLASGVTGGGLTAYGSGNQIYYNVLYNNPYGISLKGSGNHVIYNNTIYNSSVAGFIGGSGGSGTVIRNNIVSTSGTHFYNEGNLTSVNTFSNNLCSSSSTECTAVGAIVGNPLFTSTAAHDFNLLAGSPAIEAGTATITGAISISACGTLPGCYYGSRPDIGAKETGGVAVLPPSPQLVLALPLDDGGGTSAVDVSGQKNNASLIGGATWDNAGKYGKAILFDGTGYLNVPATPSLALTSGMTLEAWVYPTVAPSGAFFTVIFKDTYYLYAASESGFCPALVFAPLGGYSSTTSAQQYLCATAAPPTNQWSHLAITHDGVTMTVYLDGKPIATRTSTDPMATSSAALTIGASIYGENFIGKIDEPRVYNYARNPAQIVSDMNTPLIGPPGKYVEIAAPASVEISSASTLEVGAD